MHPHHRDGIAINLQFIVNNNIVRFGKGMTMDRSNALRHVKSFSIHFCNSSALNILFVGDLRGIVTCWYN